MRLSSSVITRLPPLGAQQHLVLGALEVDHRHARAFATRGEQRGLVHEVLQIGAHEARRTAADDLEIDVVRERNARVCTFRIS